jgi:hypothetical protein
MFKTKVVEKIKKTFYDQYFFLKNHAIYGLIWKNIVKQDRPQQTAWCTPIACCIPTATNTH